MITVAGRVAPFAPMRWLLTVTFLTGSLFPLVLLLQFKGGEWLDVWLVMGLWVNFLVRTMPAWRTEAGSQT